MSGATANASFASGVDEIADFNIKVYDPFNMVSTGAAWKATVPVSGKWLVIAAAQWDAATGSNAIAEFDIHIDGGATLHRVCGYRYSSAVISVNATINGSVIVDLLAGQYFDIQGLQTTATDPLGITTDASTTYIIIQYFGA